MFFLAKRKYYNSRFTKTEIKEIQLYLQSIFKQDEDCYVKIFNKKTKEFRFYNINIVREVGKLQNVLNHFGKEDLMITPNPFKTMERATEGNLFSINTICVDVDYKRMNWCKNLPPESVIKFLELDYFDTKIPKPNFIEHGNQLRLIYKIEPTYIPRGNVAVRTLCNRISENFALILKDEFNAERQKAEKFIRIPHSINTKTDEEVKLINYSNEAFKLNDLKEQWLDDLPEWYFKWKQKKNFFQEDNKKQHFFNSLDFNRKRLSDFRKIQYYLNTQKETDLRHRLCFLYHNYSLLIYKESPPSNCNNIFDEAIKDMLKFNEEFNLPLPNKEIISDTKFLRYKQYKYGNDTLMNFLELTTDLCDYLNLESVYETKSKELINKDYYKDNKVKLIDNQKEYNLKNKEKISEYKKEKYKEQLKKQGKLTKAEEKKIIKAKIKDLLGEGLTQKDIAEKLNFSLATIKRYIQSLRKEGLLE